ncbi:MAG: hypothetical protein WCQ32_00980 [bacterium]
MKNVEAIDPLHGEDAEEEAFLYKNDKAHNFVPVEQIPDPDANKEFSDKEDPYNESAEYTEKEADRITKLQNEIQLNFSKQEGVASYGPDVVQDMETSGDTDHSIYDVDLPKTEKISSHTIPDKLSTDRKYQRMYRRGHQNTGARHENLKTMNESKKQRTFGARIKAFIFGQNNTAERTIEEKIEDHIEEENQKYKKRFPEYFS